MLPSFMKMLTSNWPSKLAPSQQWAPADSAAPLFADYSSTKNILTTSLINLSKLIPQSKLVTPSSLRPSAVPSTTQLQLASTPLPSNASKKKEERCCMEERDCPAAAISWSLPLWKPPKVHLSCRKSISVPFSSCSATQLLRKPSPSTTACHKASAVVFSLKTSVMHSDGLVLMVLTAVS